jgi:hypothetical protein
VAARDRPLGYFFFATFVLFLPVMVVGVFGDIFVVLLGEGELSEPLEEPETIKMSALL